MTTLILPAEAERLLLINREPKHSSTTDSMSSVVQSTGVLPGLSAPGIVAKPGLRRIWLLSNDCIMFRIGVKITAVLLLGRKLQVVTRFGVVVSHIWLWLGGV